jgi:hypothetical protein
LWKGKYLAERLQKQIVSEVLFFGKNVSLKEVLLFCRNAILFAFILLVGKLGSSGSVSEKQTF